jgi:hypothetical protein
MLRIDQFDEVFTAHHKYTSKSVNDINHARTVLGGKNFFDRLLDLLHIKAAHLYPPKSTKELRELHSLIIAAKCAEHNKQSVLYYLLKDCNLVKGVDLADAFQKACYLPSSYWICMQGLWYLDKLQWKVSVYIPL